MDIDMTVRQYKPRNLTCEYIKNPIGIDSSSPKLGWMTSAEAGFFQSGYQIQVASSLSLLQEGKPDVWDSGRVSSNSQFGIVYEGSQLMPFTCYWWRVRVWDRKQQISDWSEPEWFVTGVFNRNQWPAKTFKPNNYAVRMARREFNLQDKPILAYLFVAAQGEKANSYRAMLNGKRVGDDVSIPGPLEYFTMRYRGYDVTGMLNKGLNVINLDYIKGVSCVLKVFFEDKTEFMLISDKDWSMLKDSGPYTMIGYTNFESGMHHGKAEEYDANLLPSGWYEPGFDCSDCIPPISPNGLAWEPLFIKYLPIGVKIGEKLSPISITQIADKAYLVDFGKNSSGFPSVKLRVKPKTTVTIRMAEKLEEDKKTLDMSSYGNWYPPYVKYTALGKEEEYYEPCFMHTGFRYILVENLDYTPSSTDFCANFIHSDVKKELDFSCSNPDLNYQFSCFKRSFLSNLVNIPTDCPGRERRGWTGDSFAVIEAQSIYFNVLKFYERWFEDMMDCQRMSGWMPVEFPMLTDDHVDLNWPMHTVIIPWVLYQHYHDREFLEKYRENMVKYIELLRQSSDEEHCFTESLYSYGDWLAEQPATKPFLGMAYYFYVTKLMAQIEDILGHSQESEEYDRLSQEIAQSINKKFLRFDKGKVYYDNNSQSANAHALHFGFCPEKYREMILSSLIDDIDEKNRNTTGFMGQTWLYAALTDAGRPDIAYRQICNSAPGNLLYCLKKYDCTTVPEKFPGTSSMNHAFLAGGPATWLFNVLLGIRPDQPGYKSFVIKPWLAPDIDFAQGKMETLYGTIAVLWRRSGEVVDLELTVPENTSAKIILPIVKHISASSGEKAEENKDETILVVYSGQHNITFTVK